MYKIFTILFLLCAMSPILASQEQKGDVKDSATKSQIVVEKRALTEVELSKVLHLNVDRKNIVNAQVYVNQKLEAVFENIQSKPCRCEHDNPSQYNFVDENMRMVSVSKEPSMEGFLDISIVLITEEISQK